MTQCNCGKVIKEIGFCSCGGHKYIKCPVCGEFTRFTDLCDACYQAKNIKNPENARKLLTHMGFTREQIDPGLARVLEQVAGKTDCEYCIIPGGFRNCEDGTFDSCIEVLWNWALATSD